MLSRCPGALVAVSPVRNGWHEPLRAHVRALSMCSEVSHTHKANI